MGGRKEGRDTHQKTVHRDLPRQYLELGAPDRRVAA